MNERRERPGRRRKSSTPTRARAARESLLLPFLLAAIIVAAYSSSLPAPFIFDDDRIVTEFGRHGVSAVRAMVGTTRPVVQLSFAANHALGGLDVRGYHAANIAIHVIAALLLLGIVRRTLGHDRIAFVIALFWAVHPLLTESVTFISQRAESLAGLLALATLYCVIRGTRRPAWYGAAALACTIGMTTKPVMVATPAIVALYDRAFLTGSWRQRRWLYGSLAMSWVVLLVILSQHHESESTAGFSMQALSPWMYARSQPGVVLHYLRLAVWPWPLVLDYGWPVAQDAVGAVVPGILIVGLLVLSVWAFRRSPRVGFLGVAFFVLIAPSSSFVPIKDLAAEHRMYLPLVPVVALVVLGGREILRERHAVALGVVVACATGLAMITVHRNAQYLSPIDMWRDVVAHRPDNARAHNNLAFLLFEARQVGESASEAAKAVELDASYADAHDNLGRALAELGRDGEAEREYTTALRLRADDPATHNNFGLLLQRLGKTDLALQQYDEALRLDADFAEAYNNRGVALASLRRYEDAVADYDRSLRLKPGSVEVRGNLGNAMLMQGNYSEAIRQYAAALQMAPGYPELHYNMALALSAQGRQDEAKAHYEQALRLKPQLGALPALRETAATR